MNFIKKGSLVFLLFLVNQHLSCVSHYYLSGQLCLQCNSNCLECQIEPTFCLSCQDKYYLSNHTCTTCPQQCSSCNNSLTCSTCDLGSYLKNGRCAQCMNKCATCNETTCFTCMQGYIYSSNCTLCTPGYFWNNIYAVCNKCSPGCQSCTDLAACSVCLDNYLNEKGTCRYNAPASTSSDKSQMKIFIIIGAVAAGILALACIIYIVYRYIASKRIKEVNAQASQVDIRLSQSQGLCEQLSDQLGCVICKGAKGDIIFTCGHDFHEGCIKDRPKTCPLCPQKLPEKQVFFDHIQDASEAQSEMTSEQSRKQAYLDNSTVKDTNAELQIVRMEQ